MSNEPFRLEVDNVSYSYGKVQALNAVSFTIKPGCFSVLLGYNGAGKTTLFSLLTGLYHAHKGHVIINGYDIAKRPSKALYHVGVVFQQRSLDMDLSVWQNLRYSANLYGLSAAVAKKRAMYEIERFKMQDCFNTKIRHLSGGQIRRIEIVRALIQRPNLLILDEPTVGLDIQSRNMIIAHVRTLCRDGLSVLWTTHLLDEVQLDDTILILSKSEMTVNGIARDITAATEEVSMKQTLSALL